MVVLGFLIDPTVLGSSLGWDKKDQNQVGGAILGLAVLALTILILVYASSAYAQGTQELAFEELLLINYLIFQVFNLGDLVVIDWLIYMKMKPTFMRPEDYPSTDNLSWHV